jgi:putative oxidoreductase
MKMTSLIARILLGALFVFAGLNHLMNFLPRQPMPAGPAGEFLIGIADIGYLNFIGVMEVIGGLLLIVNQFVPLGLTILGPIIINIIVLNVLIMPKALPVAALLVILWILGAWPLRSMFFPLLQRKPTA